MNEFQEKVFDYLTSNEGTGSARRKALKELMNYGFFNSHEHAEVSVEIFTNKLNTWEKNETFCADGINKARKALLLSRTKFVTVILEIETDSNLDKMYNSNDYSLSGGLAEQIAEAGFIRGKAIGGIIEYGWNVLNVRQAKSAVVKDVESGGSYPWRKGCSDNHLEASEAITPHKNPRTVG